jgi:hypothetical protein
MAPASSSTLCPREFINHNRASRKSLTATTRGQSYEYQIGLSNNHNRSYWIEQAPQSKLLTAAGTTERFHVNQWLAFVSSELHRTFSPWLWDAKTADSTKQAARDKLAKRFASLSRSLQRSVPDRRHVHGCGRLRLHDRQLVEFSQGRPQTLFESLGVHGASPRGRRCAKRSRPNGSAPRLRESPMTLTL